MGSERRRGKAKSGDQLSRGELVHLKLLDAIRAGEFRPGERIREAEIAKWLGVSRTPVREAFRRLQADGLLVFEPWRGVVVAELDQQQLIELYAMRKVLEGTAAGLAAQHAAESQIATLAELIDTADTAADAAERAELNRHFHQNIYAAAHNRYLLKALNALRDSMALLPSTTYALTGRHEIAQGEHRDIVGAIARRDPKAAEAAARHHIAEAEKARLKMIIEMNRGNKDTTP
ncbi:MAG: GntR family transcriptional regulator [Magnetovibrio sp.]|nr:GntR family transcriptional regulator [Magnetovibrio sp.]